MLRMQHLILAILTLLTTILAPACAAELAWTFDGTSKAKSGADFKPAGASSYVGSDLLKDIAGKAVAINTGEGSATRLVCALSPKELPVDEYTLEAWVLPTNTSNPWHRLLLLWGKERAFHLAIHNGKASLYHAQTDGKERVVEGGHLQPYRWYHIVAVARKEKKQLELWLNGKLLGTNTYDGTLYPVKQEQLGLGDSASTPSNAVAFNGYVDSISLWKTPLTADAIKQRTASGGKNFQANSSPAAKLEEKKIKQLYEQNKDNPLGMLLDFCRFAKEGNCNKQQLSIAANFLTHKDPFVRAAAEWVITRKVGYDNNFEEVVWTKDSDAPWLQKWEKIPLTERIEIDWAKQAISLGLHNDAPKLRDSVAGMVARVKQMTLDTAPLQKIAKEMDATQDLPTLRGKWLEARRTLRPLVFKAAKLDIDQLLLYTRYTMHYKPNVCGVHTSWAYKPGGDIVLATGLQQPKSAKSLLNGKLGPGHVHGLDLDYNADRLAFGWASQPEWPPRFSTRWPRRGNDCYAYELRNTTIPVHLYEAPLAKNGSVEKIEQLTDHNFWTDNEPAYCPDGRIAFTSDRSGHSPSCDGYMNDLTDTNIYSLSADRKTIRRLTNQKDVDMHPHTLDNGLVAYLRWEYQERDFWEVHSIWTVRSDGTMSDALFKQHLALPTSVRDARSVPGTNKLIAIAAGHHALPKGPVVLINPSQGLNAAEAIEILTPNAHPQERGMAGKVVASGGVQEGNEGLYITPYALNATAFLTSYAYGNPKAARYRNVKSDADANGFAVYLIDIFGNKELLYRDPFFSCYSPLPVKKRKRPPVLPDATDFSQNYATCLVTDVYQGVPEIERGKIKSIRISESLPWPIVPGEGVKRWDLSTKWCPSRVLGTVPVEKDGSAHFRVPVADNASVSFQALDEKGMELRRMRSSVSFQPGEKRACTGCHETNSTTPYTAPATKQCIAATKSPVVPTPPSWDPGIQISFEEMAYPVLQKHCASCHTGTKPPGGLDLSKNENAAYNNARRFIAISPRRGDGSITQVKQYGSHKSKLILKLLEKDTPCKHKMSPQDWEKLVTWVDAKCRR